MTNETLRAATRVPVDDEYATLVGKAVYIFAYYEWSIIWILDFLQTGFVGRYSRGNPMTAGQVKDALLGVINSQATAFTVVTRQELQECCREFERLVVKRNALIHAHPCTGITGSQILAYQAKAAKANRDMKWSKQEAEAIVAEFDAAACMAGVLLDKLRCAAAA